MKVIGDDKKSSVFKTFLVNITIGRFIFHNLDLVINVDRTKPMK